MIGFRIAPKPKHAARIILVTLLFLYDRGMPVHLASGPTSMIISLQLLAGSGHGHSTSCLAFGQARKAP